MQAGEQRQVDEKADEVREQRGERHPGLFGGGGVAHQCILRLVRQIQERGIVQVGEGSARKFLVAAPEQFSGAQVDARQLRDVFGVGVQGGEQKQRGAEQADGGQQLGSGAARSTRSRITGATSSSTVVCPAERTASTTHSSSKERRDCHAVRSSRPAPRRMEAAPFLFSFMSLHLTSPF